MPLNKSEIHKKIILALISESELSTEQAQEIAFHITDWLDDLQGLYSFCEDPDSRTTEQIGKMLFAFLIHVPNHVAAASKLLTGVAVKDIFNVNALSDNDEDVG